MSVILNKNDLIRILKRKDTKITTTNAKVKHADKSLSVFGFTTGEDHIELKIELTMTEDQ